MRAVRRAGDVPAPGLFGADGWTPLQMNGLCSWWGAHTGLADEGAGAVLRDLGPGGFHLTAAGSPTIEHPALLGYRPALRLPSTPSYFTSGTLASTSAASGNKKTAYAVVVMEVTTQHHALVCKGTSDANEEFTWLPLNDTTTYLDCGGASPYMQSGGGSYDALTAYVMTARADNTLGWRLRRNGTVVSSGSPGVPSASGTGPLQLGGGREGAQQQALRGWIAEGAYFTTGHTDAEMTYVERRLGARYGITVL